MCAVAYIKRSGRALVLQPPLIFERVKLERIRGSMRVPIFSGKEVFFGVCSHEDFPRTPGIFFFLKPMVACSRDRGCISFSR